MLAEYDNTKASYQLKGIDSAEPVSLTLHSALKKLNTEHSIAYRGGV